MQFCKLLVADTSETMSSALWQRLELPFSFLQILADLTLTQKEDVGSKMLNNNYIRRLLDVFRVSTEALSCFQKESPLSMFADQACKICLVNKTKHCKYQLKASWMQNRNPMWHRRAKKWGALLWSAAISCPLEVSCHVAKQQFPSCCRVARIWKILTPCGSSSR